MSRRWILAAIFCVDVTLAGLDAARAATPDSLGITCDVDRTTFRSAAGSATTATFRLWNAESGGLQCGSDHVVAMADVLAQRPKGDKFDGQRPRKYLELSAVLGTAGASGTPAVLCAGTETWIDVQIGSTTLTCDFSADPNSKQGVAPDAPARRRLQPVAYAQESAHAATCTTCDALAPQRTYVEVSIPADANQGPLPYNTGTRVDFSVETADTLGEWDTAAKEFIAQNPGVYLVDAQVLFENIVDGATYFLYINSNNVSNIHTSKSAIHVMPSASGSQPGASLGAHTTAILQLDAGEKIWVHVDHNYNGVPLPSLYWRDYNTRLYITRLD